MKKLLTRKLIILALWTLPIVALTVPAVRQTDSTSHSGTVTSGSANVLVNGKPMARVGSTQTCPIPGHVGGTIVSGSATVFVNGAPAAKVGSVANCVGSTTTIIGGSPNVNIGN